MKWRIQDVWNEAEKAKTYEPRDYLYASEVGRSYLDVWYALKGVAPTNPFDARIQRIFDAGSAFEWLIKRVMESAGILIDEETKYELDETPECLSVHGRADMIVGGKVDKKVIQESTTNMPDFLKYKLNAIAEKFDGKDLNNMLSEIKSVNSNAFWSHNNMDEKTGYFKGYDHHRLQMVTYLLGRELEEGRLFYVSRDDLCIMETDVLLNDWRGKWKEWVMQMTEHVRSGKEPNREEDIVYDITKVSKFYPNGKWSKNWNIERSPYLTLITGKSKDDWLDMVEKQVKENNDKIKDTKANREKNSKPSKP